MLFLVVKKAYEKVISDNPAGTVEIPAAADKYKIDPPANNLAWLLTVFMQISLYLS